MLIRKLSAGVGAAAGLYIASALQNGPDQVDANLCKLLRRVFAGVPDQCVSVTFDKWGALSAEIFVGVCLFLLLWDFGVLARLVGRLRQPIRGSRLGMIFGWILFLSSIGGMAVGLSLIAAGGNKTEQPQKTSMPIKDASPAPKPVTKYSRPKEQNLIGKARFLYDHQLDTMTVISRQDVNVVSISKDTSLYYIVSPIGYSNFIARFVLSQENGPYDVEVYGEPIMPGGLYAMTGSAIENERGYVKVRFYVTPATVAVLGGIYTTQPSEVAVSFYRREK
jgi:hypothetical protein